MWYMGLGMYIGYCLCMGMFGNDNDHECLWFRFTFFLDGGGGGRYILDMFYGYYKS